VSARTINAVAFINQDDGWVGAVDLGLDGSARLQVFSTHDGGQTWSPSVVDQGTAYADAAVSTGHFFFIDSSTGYYDFALASSSATQAGALFKTSDGGQKWEKKSLPVFGAIGFASTDSGWVSGSNGGGNIFVTSDSGAKWEAVTVGSRPAGEAQGPFTTLPTQGEGELASRAVAMTTDPNGDASTQIFKTVDQGKAWDLLASARLGGAGALVANPAAQLADGTVLTVSGAGTEIAVVSPDGLVKSSRHRGCLRASGSQG
jgi:photosystem II stability/assembly factor-like uncharacterized protein